MNFRVSVARKRLFCGFALLQELSIPLTLEQVNLQGPMLTAVTNQVIVLGIDAASMLLITDDWGRDERQGRQPGT